MKNKPGNLQMVSDFPGDLEKDGIHFTILSGISYVQFIVDQAAEMASKPIPKDVAGDVAKTNGALIVGLEHRMDRIESKFDDLDSRHWEESDNLSNERDLDRFIMSGEFYCSSVLCGKNILSIAVK